MEMKVDPMVEKMEMKVEEMKVEEMKVEEMKRAPQSNVVETVYGLLLGN
jgi:hypothetical protein